MTVLGIDPGTACGWALVTDGRRVASGVWDLKPRRHEGGGMRFLRARSMLRQIVGSYPVDAVAYEEVRRHMGVDAAHVYGGIVAVVAAELEERSIPYRGIPFATAKRCATGKGNADKAAMVAAFVAREGVEPADDNEADALFIALALLAELT
ncbi:MAG TPA: crossover junction endodeoxyribonuclease RuvC [Actinomycetota bacterium]|jgi:Holliday junction resolvasome RuvABC endonuclease subunit